LEAVCVREAERPFADQHDVIGAFEHEARHCARRLDPLESADGAALLELARHDRRVELHDAFLVRQPAIADALIFGIQLDDVRTGHDRIERAAAALQELPRRGIHRLAPALTATAEDRDLARTRWRRRRGSWFRLRLRG